MRTTCGGADAFGGPWGGHSADEDLSAGTLLSNMRQWVIGARCILFAMAVTCIY